MSSEEKVVILNKVLKQSARMRKGTDAVYFCPNCKHRKRKLEINLDTGKYNCWVCEFSGLNFFTLFKKLGIPRELGVGLFDRIKNVHSEAGSLDVNFLEEKSVEIPKPILPVEYRPLSDFNKSMEYSHAIRYLLNRNITKWDILRHQIGYCESGEFAHRIIIPSFDSNGELNFFVGRSYYDSSLKYKNYEGSKNVIGFESSVDFNQEITLVEGVFDVFAIRYNAVPLFGKTLSSKLKCEILSKKVPLINVLLDDDAVKSSIKIVEFLMKNNIPTRFINIGKKDPSVLGFAETWAVIKKSVILDFQTFMSLKLKNI